MVMAIVLCHRCHGSLREKQMTHSEPLPLCTEFLMQMSAELEEPQSIGDTPLGDRRIAYVRSGLFSGPKLRGQVLPGGGDWLLFRRDGVGQLDVRITLRTDDDCLIFVSYRGVSDMPSGVRQRILSGEDIDPAQYYFRIAPVFETSCEKYGWLNRIITVGVGIRKRDGVAYSIYAVK